MEKSERYVVVSADGHAGADLLDYRGYLPSKWHEDFDRWAATYHDGWNDIDEGNQKVGVASAEYATNWDSDARQAVVEAQGIAGEVLFPNTTPPFFPTAVIAASTPGTRDEYEHRWAGLQAHNRWLADFCAELPGCRAGIAQVFLNDVEDTVEEIHWVKESGLTGGILLPVVFPDSDLEPVYSEVYEPIWTACEELGVPVNQHGAVAGDPDRRDRGIAFIETPWYASRALWHLIFGGVFERHPNLRFALTENLINWVGPRLGALDALYADGQVPRSMTRMFMGPLVDDMRMSPSEYFRRNIWVGASFMMPTEAACRFELGADRIMWGADFPHGEGTVPFTREALRATFADVPEHECRLMLGETAAKVYDLDLDLLRGVAARIGPTVAEVAAELPVDDWPVVPESTQCPVFNRAYAAFGG